MTLLLAGPPAITLGSPSDAASLAHASKGGRLSSGSFQTQIVAGAASGLISCIALQPLDLLKTVRQTRHTDSATGTPQTTTPVGPRGRPVFQFPISIVQSVRRRQRGYLTSQLANDAALIWRAQGVRGLWRGTGAALARSVPGYALYFAMLERARCILETRAGGGASAWWRDFVAGAGARVIATTVLMPISVAKTRIECGLYGYRSTSEAISAIVRKEGARRLFSGTAMTLVRDIPYAGLYVLLYERAKLKIRRSAKIDSEQGIRALGACIAGTTTSCITQPFDYIKTRLQTSSGGIFSASVLLSKTVKENGVRELFKGGWPRILRKSAQSAIAWFVYESVSDSLTHPGS